MSHSGYATNTDIMHALDDLRRHINGRLDDHERRISILEPVKPQVDRLTEHVSEIGRTQTVILERVEGMERAIGEALRIAAKEQASQLVDMVRVELAGMREEVAGLREDIRSRPCLHGECEVRDA